ncbi:hypothetical protein N566_25540 [Streptomycetaceae bacterium MP113-05]|nr:hypothetical protein N566_25540 [Streptomycetaceae bacterium MP113-05]
MSSEQTPSGQHPKPPGDEKAKYADRSYRSPAAIASGVLLLALGLWLTADAVLRGSGRTPMAALAGFFFAAPLVIAFTLRPVVFAGEQRLRVRNPFRTIVVPWPSVELLRSGYSSEVFADGSKYQLFSIPVSIRARKSAQRHNQRANQRARSGRPAGRGVGGLGRDVATDGDMQEKRAASDTVMEELRELTRLHGEGGSQPAPEGPVTVRWAYEILVPMTLGAAGLLFFLAT